MNIDGVLHTEAMGDVDSPLMIFVHPNPMDSSSWLYQMAHFSTWYRCVSVDLPGYGRSPEITGDITMSEIAEACWEAVAHRSERDEAVLVGCSVGGNIVQHMYHLRPEATQAVVISGSGWTENKEFVPVRITGYREKGIGYRYEYTLEDFSAEFAGGPLGRWFADMFTERDHMADVTSILRMFDALGVPDPEWLQRDLQAPVLILSGDQDSAHEAAFDLRDRLPNVEFVVIENAGHACQIEQPWVFDSEVIRFLHAHGHTFLPAQ